MKTQYLISDMDLKKALSEIDASLSKVEVKGDSVFPLYTSRAILKAIYDSIQGEVPVEEEKE